MKSSDMIIFIKAKTYLTEDKQHECQTRGQQTGVLVIPLPSRGQSLSPDHLAIGLGKK